MAGVNRVILVGRLGQDPETRYTTSGQAVATFSIATSENWNDKEGQRQERTEWHRIVVWGKQAETCGQYLSRGRQVYIEGKLQTRQWEDRDGNKRSTTEIIGQVIQFLGDRNGGGGGGGNQGGNFGSGGPSNEARPQNDMPRKNESSFGNNSNTNNANNNSGFGGPMPPISDDDVPF